MEYYAIIVAIEEYHDSKKIGKVDFALNDALGVKSALVKLGYKKDNIELLTNSHATRTTILEVIKKISKYADKDDIILFYYAGHGFNSDGKNLISCVDTNLSSLDDTCISLQDILGLFNDSDSTRIMLFLDCCHSGLEFGHALRSPISTFSSDDLKYKYSDTEYLTGFAACKGDEKSRPDHENKHGVWSWFLIKALSGEAEKIYNKGLLLSDNLQKYLKEETYYRVKLITSEKKTQTPIQFGKNTDKFIVADISKILDDKIIKKAANSIKFEKITLLKEEEGFVSSLPGFIRGKHHSPKEISTYHDKWIREIAKELIEEEINEVGKKLRETLRLKIKEILEVNVEDGLGTIVTTSFDYTVEISQSEDEAGCFMLTRSLQNFKNTEIINSENFNKVFADFFDEISFYTMQEIDVVKIIEKIEELDKEDRISVSYDYADTSKCTIKIPTLSQSLYVNEHSVIIKFEKSKSPLELSKCLQKCYQILASSEMNYLLE